MSHRRLTSVPQPQGDTAPATVNLDRYVPASLTWVANELSRGASQHCLSDFDAGIETWRCLVLLAIERAISAQHVSSVLGMDKGSVSRCFRSMQERGLIRIGLLGLMRRSHANLPAVEVTTQKHVRALSAVGSRTRIQE